MGSKTQNSLSVTPIPISLPKHRLMVANRPTLPTPQPDDGCIHGPTQPLGLPSLPLKNLAFLDRTQRVVVGRWTGVLA